MLRVWRYPQYLGILCWCDLKDVYNDMLFYVMNVHVMCMYHECNTYLSSKFTELWMKQLLFLGHPPGCFLLRCTMYWPGNFFLQHISTSYCWCCTIRGTPEITCWILFTIKSTPATIFLFCITRIRYWCCHGIRILFCFFVFILLCLFCCCL